jgi:hypothetical protein
MNCNCNWNDNRELRDKCFIYSSLEILSQNINYAVTRHNTVSTSHILNLFNDNIFKKVRLITLPTYSISLSLYTYKINNCLYCPLI